MTHVLTIERLIELWDEFTAQWGIRAYGPSMTDFIAWLREDALTETEQSVKEDRTELYAGIEPEGGGHPADTFFSSLVNSEPTKLLDDVKPMLGKTITRQDIKKVRQLYERGYALARIRQELGLRISLQRMQTIVNKPW